MKHRIYCPYCMEIFFLFNLFGPHHVSWLWFFAAMAMDGITDISGRAKSE